MIEFYCSREHITEQKKEFISSFVIYSQSDSHFQKYELKIKTTQIHH